MENIYQSNLEALSKWNPALHEQLQGIEENRNFEVFESGNGSYDILDLKRECWVHNEKYKPSDDRANEMLQFREYLFLYFFGIGNGRLIKQLLSNEKLTYLLVIEPEIEMLYVALNLVDFSDEILSGRLQLFSVQTFTFLKAVELFHTENAKFYLRQFILHVPNEYYTKERIQDYQEVHSLFIKTIEYMVSAFGNDINDSLLGVKQHISNLPDMVGHVSYADLCKSKNSDTAIIVSTGPSLYKQLDLLKEYQDHVTIISVDASFPILIEHGIKADLVCSMERDEVTSRFFKETEKADHEDVVFVCASLQHKNVIHNIKAGKTVIAMRPFAYNMYFDLHDFGYLCYGMSAANMAHELASDMGFKQAIFIGQDLAYGKDGNSHSIGHIFGEDQIKDGVNKANNNETYKMIQVPAYGKEGYVNTMIFWKIFMQFIEQHIERTANVMKSINSTEGGAHIIGSIELPFKEALKTYALKEKKQKILVDNQTPAQQEVSMQIIREKIQAIEVEGRALQQKLEHSFLIVMDTCKLFENVSKEEALNLVDDEQIIGLLDEISSIRNEIKYSVIYKDFIESIAQSIMNDSEFKLAAIKVQFVDNPVDNKLKAIAWILEHRYWLFSLSGIIESILSVVKDESNAFMQ